jgi:sigma-B regulation protein RsbU (phosphoserine phosphatase)
MYMERTLQQYLKNLQETTAAKERIESELKIAHDIQMSMVPKIFPPFPHRREFDVYATLVPAKEVGGDFYDFFFVDEDQLCFAIGDVSGKGVPASLFMAVTKTLLRATASRTGNPDEILSRLNAELCRDNASCMFVTLYTAILEIRSGRLEYSNGGHNLPYHLSNGRIQPLDNTPGMVLGAMEGVKYSTNKMVLQPGDRLLLYTDGVTEAMDERGHLLSERRLEEFLATVKNALPEDLTVALVREVRRFAAGAGQSDDITILALQYWGDDQHARGQDLS